MGFLELQHQCGVTSVFLICFLVLQYLLNHSLYYIISAETWILFS